MAIVLDADVLIADERGVFDLGRWLTAQPESQYEIAAITAAELLHGLERATETHRVRRQAYIETVFAFCSVIPYTFQTAQVHARLWADLESNGQMIGYYDLIVAAMALERGNPVASFNSRHFAAVPGLTVLIPS